nr:hypothetical protein [Tanacetum cinerariifolium]
MMNKNFSEMMRQFQTIKAVDTKCETCGGPHSFTECLTVGGYTQETAYATTATPFQTLGEDLKAITTRSGVTLDGPSVFPPPLSKEVDREPETITDQVLIESTNNVPPLVVQPSPASTSFSIISSSKMPEVTKDMEIDTWDEGKGTWGGLERGWVLFLYGGGAQEWLGKRGDFGQENLLKGLELVPELWVFDKLNFNMRLFDENLLPDPAFLCGF